MKATPWIVGIGGASLLGVASFAQLGGGAANASRIEQHGWAAEEAAVPANPLKDAWFGELHIHTRNSFDSFIFGNPIGPDEAYRFSQGEPVKFYGGQMLSWFEISPDQWAATLQQNLVSAVRMVQAFVPAMREEGWGRVINISSGGGASPPESVPDYCAAKAGLNNLTVSLSKVLARTGVTVNTVSPGCTRTDMFERNLERMAEENGWPDDYESREARFMDLGIFPCVSERYGRPEDVGTLVAFLASPHSAFVNGANYRIDGGQVQSVN